MTSERPGGETPPEAWPSAEGGEGPTTDEHVAGEASSEELRGAIPLMGRELLVPIRSSSGQTPDAALVSTDVMRHGTDDRGRFLAAFSSADSLAQLGPPGTDHVEIEGRDLFERAERADERVIVDPGSPEQIEVPAGILPFLLAGIDLATPDAMRARRPLGGMPPLEVPATIPEPFGSRMRETLAELPAVERAWLLRVGTSWTAGIELGPDAPLSEFDAIRNRLHALATEVLGTRRDLIVTDLRSAALRAHYEATAPPFYQPAIPRGFLSRLLGRG
jgi:hypothetical protein